MKYHNLYRFLKQGVFVSWPFLEGFMYRKYLYRPFCVLCALMKTQGFSVDK